MNDKLIDFIKDNKKDFPYYVRISRIKEADKNNELIPIIVNNNIVGFYIYTLKKEFKSLFISTNFRGLKLAENIIKKLPIGTTVATLKCKCFIKKMVERYNFSFIKEEKSNKANLLIFEKIA